MSSTVVLLNRALRFYEEARISRNKVSVSELAARFSRGKGRGAEEGRRLHARIWALDPYPAAYEERWACPLPLAWPFRGVWLYGVADMVVFVKGKPVEVIEYKSYSGVRKSERVQAALYGLLTELLFATRVDVYLSDGARTKRVEEWELLALEAISLIYRR